MHHHPGDANVSILLSTSRQLGVACTYVRMDFHVLQVRDGWGTRKRERRREGGGRGVDWAGVGMEDVKRSYLPLSTNRPPELVLPCRVEVVARVDVLEPDRLLTLPVPAALHYNLPVVCRVGVIVATVRADFLVVGERRIKLGVGVQPFVRLRVLQSNDPAVLNRSPTLATVLQITHDIPVRANLILRQKKKKKKQSILGFSTLACVDLTLATLDILSVTCENV